MIKDEAVDKNTLGMPVNDEWKDLTIEVWDCGGRKVCTYLWSFMIHKLENENMTI